MKSNRLMWLAVGILGASIAVASAHEDKDHSHSSDSMIKPYKEGSCCSKEHYMSVQKKELKKSAKAEYAKGDVECCSPDHYASKKADAAMKMALKKEYTEGSCCSADHYASKKMKAMKADK